MTTVLWLLCVQGLLGAFDTLYYHEWRARLPAGGAQTRDELRLHAARDFVYALIFGSLPWLAWRGLWAAALAALLLFEIVVTLCDFVVEDRVRAPQGGVFPGERSTHAIMGIVYGATLAGLVPAMLGWWGAPTALAFDPPHAPAALRLALGAMSAGVLLSGLRDLAASLGLPGSARPWR